MDSRPDDSEDPTKKEEWSSIPEAHNGEEDEDDGPYREQALDPYHVPLREGVWPIGGVRLRVCKVCFAESWHLAQLCDVAWQRLAVVCACAMGYLAGLARSSVPECLLHTFILHC